MKQKLIISAIGAALIFGIVFILFLSRPPVLIVTEQSLAMLYGTARIRKESAGASFNLFRRVKGVYLAEDAGEDIIQFAITDVSTAPYCVIFPARYFQAAQVYRRQNPEIPVIILAGRREDNSSMFDNAMDYHIYWTDSNADFHRAALAALILDKGEQGKAAVFANDNIQLLARNGFHRVFGDIENSPEVSFYSVFSQFSGIEGVTSVTLAGTGAEYLDRYKDVPVILFSWISPEFLPFDIVMVLNDSPWVQVQMAVKMLEAELTEGEILSKKMVFKGNNVEKKIIRKLKKI